MLGWKILAMRGLHRVTTSFHLYFGQHPNSQGYTIVCPSDNIHVQTSRKPASPASPSSSLRRLAISAGSSAGNTGDGAPDICNIERIYWTCMNKKVQQLLFSKKIEACFPNSNSNWLVTRCHCTGAHSTIEILVKSNNTWCFFSKHRPSGPMLSISRNVHMFVCLSVCLFVHFWGTV